MVTLKPKKTTFLGISFLIISPTDGKTNSWGFIAAPRRSLKISRWASAVGTLCFLFVVDHKQLLNELRLLGFLSLNIYSTTKKIKC